MSDTKNSKGRDWTFIVYPSSAPDNWRTIIDDTHVRWVESPLHDKDVNPDGEIKKAHWHILISYDGPVTYKKVSELTSKVNSPIPKKVASGRGMVRYFIHLDNPEKYQYKISDIVAHGGADVAEYFKQSVTEKMEVLELVEDYILDNEITTFSSLIRYAKIEHPEWMDTLRQGSTIYLNALIKGIWQEHRQEQQKQLSQNQDIDD